MPPVAITKKSEEMKRADKRSSITIMVLGDEDVGKSSLISTFVSRYYSESVPAIMTRVRLPPDPNTSCVTTIVDSQGGDKALMGATQLSPSLSDPIAVTSSETSLTSFVERASNDPSPKTTESVDKPVGPIENVDSIVLVYDLDRVETFHRLETHWLPLIEGYYGNRVPVIVAENKLDLFRPNTSSSDGAASSASQQVDDQVLLRKRQQIVSLMQRFPFVRQCIKCSAKTLLRVDDVFLKAQQAVLYPFVPPLYDLKSGQLTSECKRALIRIFRMFDRDHDGLLSDAELDRFQRETFNSPVFEKDLAAWKKVVSRNNPSEIEETVLQDGKFTVQGFLIIFDLFISQNRLDVVWQALRKFNYDDDLNLHIPYTISSPDDILVQRGTITPTPWKLSTMAKQFLTRLFMQFDSDEDGFISPEDIISIFAILPPPALPPWHPMRAPELFEGCFSVPKESPTTGSSSGSDSPVYGGDASLIVPSASIVLHQSLFSTSGVSILSASDSLPSVDVGGMYPLSKSVSYLEWMGHWHAICAISPSVTRSELYRLGYFEAYSRKNRQSVKVFGRRHQAFGNKKKKADDDVDAIQSSVGANSAYYDTTLKSCELRILVLGSRGCGKTALLNYLCGSIDGTPCIETTRTTRAQTSSTFLKVKRSFGRFDSSPANEREGEDAVVHFVFTDVPESAAARQKEHYRQLSELFGSPTSPKESSCDLAVLMYDCTDSSSLAVAKDLEAKLLCKETPRVFVGAKCDHMTPPDSFDPRSRKVLDDAVAHCRKSDLESPIMTTATETRDDERAKILNHFARCALSGEPGIDPLRSRPHEAEKRRVSARRRKMLWIGGLVSMGVVVVVGVGLLWSGSAKKDQKGGLGWLRSIFSGNARLSRDAPISS